VHTDRRGNTSGQKYYPKGSRKESKIQQFMYRDTANVEHEMCDYPVVSGLAIELNIPNLMPE
jgi:hypothetical protein